MKRVLVTGAGGFLGRHFCRALSDRGAHVIGTVRNVGRLAGDAGFEPAVVEDLHDRASLRRALRGIDTVVHLAARVHVLRDTSPNPLAECRRTNVEGTRVLLEESARAGVRAFLFMSSISAIGEPPDGTLSESTPPRPSTAYGRSKLEAEGRVRDHAAATGMHAVILRPPGIYGPEMKGNLLRLFRWIDRGYPVPVPVPANSRSLIFVGNLVAAGLAAVGGDAVGCRTYLVCDGEALSTARLVREIAGALGKPARVVPIPLLPMRFAGRAGDLVSRFAPWPLNSTAVERMFGSLVVDARAIARETGYAPPFPPAEGLTITADWFRRTAVDSR